uniref:N-acetylmuramoyl-L-alanine amidase n=1 Tax=Plectus sambesii TaxID=2011161 RepID=A0A914X355_9BILA
MLFQILTTFVCWMMLTTTAAQSNTCPPTEYGPPSGVIQSPGFSQHLNYGNDINCVYNIRVADGSHVMLTVNSFVTEQCCDRLTIFDGPSTQSPVIISWSGRVSPGSYAESTGNVVTVVFQTDNTVNAAGFSVQYAPTHSQYTTTTTARPTLQIIDWRNKTTYWGSRPSPNDIHALVLHHTQEPTVEATMDALNRSQLSVHYIAAKNGTIYQLVDDSNRAWHAGAGTWGDYQNMNDISIGIEIVNSGDEPFPVIQEKAVAALSQIIVTKYNILPKNIVSHADFGLARKIDVSGYFDYKLFYAELGLFPGLFMTNLPVSEQKKVLYQESNSFNAAVKIIQQHLHQYGYALTADGFFGNETELVAEAFNRHFCPEIFIKESIDSQGDDVRHWQNKRWYGISQERLDYLIAHT